MKTPGERRIWAIKRMAAIMVLLPIVFLAGSFLSVIFGMLATIIMFGAVITLAWYWFTLLAVAACPGRYKEAPDAE